MTTPTHHGQSPDLIASSHCSRDRGAILPLALVLTVVFGALVVSITTYVATALRTTQVTETRVHRLADAESGMRTALVALQDTGVCPSGDLTIPSNGATVSVTGCDMIAVESSETTRTFGVVMTGLHAPEQAFDGKNNSKEPVEIGGDIFLGSNVTGKADIEKLIALGEVLVQRTGCTGYPPEPMTWLGAYPGGDETKKPTGAQPICTRMDWSEISPPPSLSDLAIPTESGGSSNVDGCRVFDPGSYTSININNNSSVYFRSGVYRITGKLDIGNGSTLTGGHPDDDIPTILLGDDNGSCRTAQEADIKHGSGPGGVVFVFVGNGHFDFGNNTTTELFGYPVGTRSMSVIAYPNTPEFSGIASTRTITQNLMDGSPNGYVTFRGEFWAPASWASLHVPSSGKAGAGFLGGLTIARTNYHLTGSAEGGLLFMLENAPSRYRFRLVVTATDDRGGTTSVSSVVLGAEDGVTVESWRVY